MVPVKKEKKSREVLVTPIMFQSDIETWLQHPVSILAYLMTM